MNRLSCRAFLLTIMACLLIAAGTARVAFATLPQPTEPPTAATMRFANSDEADIFGTVVTHAAGDRNFVVSIHSITLASGKVVTFDTPRTKKVLVDATTDLLSADATALPLSEADLQPGRSVHVISSNPGEPGQPVTARVVRAVIGSGGVPLPGNLLRDWKQPKNWELETRAGAALQTDENFLKVNMPEESGAQWDVMLYQKLGLEPNQKYTVKFRARSNARRFITIVTGDRLPDKTFAGTGLVFTGRAAPGWKEYQISFTTNEKVNYSQESFAPCFQLGGKVGDVSLADVSFARGEYPLVADSGDIKPHGENMLEAANDPNTWQLFQTEAARAKLSGEANALRIDIERSGEYVWHLQLMQPPIDLDNGKTYIVSFVAKSSRPRQITVSAQVQGGNFHSIGLSQAADLTTEWKPYSFSFKAADVVAQRNLAPQFLLGSDTGAAHTVWLSNIELTEK